VLERALRARGHRRTVAWDYRASGTIEAVAGRLARFARASLDGELHVVAHSLGGIVARLWLQELGGRERARSLVTLSTPHRGLARIPGAGVLPLVREIVAGSALLERLERGAAALDGLPSLAIVSARDHFVRPWHQAGFAGARLVPVSSAGHVGVLFSPEVARLVGDHLEITRR
jgi:pimeloyl-ACP methyl ester carboxylesterase